MEEVVRRCAVIVVAVTEIARMCDTPPCHGAQALANAANTTMQAAQTQVLHSVRQVVCAIVARGYYAEACVVATMAPTPEHTASADAHMNPIHPKAASDARPATNWYEK